MSSAQISKKVEGEIHIEIGYLFNAHHPFKGDNTSRAVIVPGMTIESGGGGAPSGNLSTANKRLSE